MEYAKYDVDMSKKPMSKMGRPPLPADARRSAVITIRMKADERKQLEEEAQKAGLTMSSYLLRCWRKKGNNHGRST